MKKPAAKFFICLAACLLAFAGMSQAATADGRLIVRINSVERISQLLDQVAGPIDPAKPNEAPAPGAMLRMMLGGTDWIDPARAITATVTLQDEKPQLFVFIPFSRPNPDFAASHKAMTGPDYYFIANPPVSSAPREILAPLYRASAAPGKDLVSVEIPVAGLLKNLSGEIEKGLAAIRQKAPQDGAPQAGAEQLDWMAQTMQSLGRQVKNLSIGLDLSQDVAGLSLSAFPVAGTDFAARLAKPRQASGFLLNYQPQGPITFRTRAYDIAAYLDLFDGLYTSMGLNFACFKKIAAPFTGESAGSMSLAGNTISTQGVWVLDGPGNDAEKLAAGMVDCISAYMKSMQDYAAAQGQALPQMPLPSLLEPISINGHKVAGISIPMTDASQQGAALAPLNLRMAVVDRFALFGSGSAEMVFMMGMVNTFREAPAAGPLMQMEMDMAQVAMMGAKSAGQPLPAKLPEKAVLSFSLDISPDKAQMLYRANVKDMKAVAALMGAMKPGQQKTVAQAPGYEPPRPQRVEGPRPEPGFGQPGDMGRRPDRPVQNAKALALKNAALAAAYGSPGAAVRHYREVLKMEPDNLKALFGTGLAYVEMERFDKALEYMDKALAMEPENAAFIYGRGWAYLKAGDQTAALLDFTRAAELGNKDAGYYLESMTRR
ncbi:MAG: tetratricopeptide repeat protein [Desulfatibacillaceae bacterium]|nr:tetratricopeptide repeat protein [Desulfatibacillaceae bacterium]